MIDLPKEVVEFLSAAGSVRSPALRINPLSLEQCAADSTRVREIPVAAELGLVVLDDALSHEISFAFTSDRVISTFSEMPGRWFSRATAPFLRGGDPRIGHSRRRPGTDRSSRARARRATPVERPARPGSPPPARRRMGDSLQHHVGRIRRLLGSRRDPIRSAALHAAMGYPISPRRCLRRCGPVRRGRMASPQHGLRRHRSSRHRVFRAVLTSDDQPLAETASGDHVVGAPRWRR